MDLESALFSSYLTSEFSAVAINQGDKGRLAFGPIWRCSDSSGSDRETIINRENLVSADKFGKMGIQTQSRYDSIGLQTVLQPGFQAKPD